MTGNLIRSRSLTNGLAPAGLTAIHGNRPWASARGGFTLIEVMMVIAIIAVLATLVTYGVNRAIIFSRQVSVKMEMTQIELALATVAKDLNNVTYIPSMILLREDMAYGSSGFEQASEAMLRNMFPGIPASTSGTAVVDWDGNSSNNSTTLLTAEQAYVFFLGGIPSAADAVGSPATTGPTGFPPSPLTGKKRPPTYDFKLNRLIKQSNGFYIYIDGWEKGNAYVVYNNINKTASYGNDDNPASRTSANWPAYVTQTSAYIPICPVRFLKSPTQLQNPKGYQIFSAGKDGVFGGPLAGAFYPESSAGADDQANFADSLLGKPID